jgi:uncharacterized protein YjbI with pentapeptide repeats
MGGLYELKRVAQDSARDRENVLEIINRFVISKYDDDKAPSPQSLEVKTAKEIMALLLRTEKINHEKLNLAGAHLEGTNLAEAHLERAHLSYAHLEGAILIGAFLNGARLGGATLIGAKGVLASDLEHCVIDETTMLDDDIRAELVKGEN